MNSREKDSKESVCELTKTLRQLKEMRLESTNSEELSFIDRIRENYMQAYAPWTADDDLLLEELFSNGMKSKDLAIKFERKVGAITSRIKKLGLRQKYQK